MVTFLSYAAASMTLTLMSFVYAWSTRHQFYPSLLFLTTHKLNIVILGNLSFFFLLLLGQLLKAVFLGSLSRDEVEELVQQSKYAITETCLALTIFREELNVRVLVLFTLLLFIKIFHWLAVMRVEHIARTHGLPLSTHLRLSSLLLFLGLLDVAFLALLSRHLYEHREASVLLLFAFEFTILTVAIVSTAAKYALHLVELRLEGRWQGKSVVLFYLELASDLTRLLLYLLFFLLICTYYGLPLHLIRELCITFYNLRERVVKFLAYRRITRNMNERFPDATREELEAGDTTCIICREEMTEAKKLQCGHNFHFQCLRTWLERSSSCPTCRANIVAAAPAAPAAVNEAPPVLPPLPPHLQAHLDAMMRERGVEPLRPASGADNAAAAAAAAAAAPPAPSPDSMQRFLSGFGGAPPQLPQPPSSASRAQSQGGIAPSAASPHPSMLPHVRLHPFFVGSPPPSSSSSVKDEVKDGQTAAQMPPAPSPTHAHMGMPFGFPPGAYSGPMQFTAPPPWMPPFLPHPSAFSHLQATSFAAPSSPLPPPPPASLDPSYLSVLAHHTSLLQTHMAMLESELRQVKLLWERQVEVQAQWISHADALAATAAAARTGAREDEVKAEEEKVEAIHSHSR